MTTHTDAAKALYQDAITFYNEASDRHFIAGIMAQLSIITIIGAAFIATNSAFIISASVLVCACMLRFFTQRYVNEAKQLLTNAKKAAFGTTTIVRPMTSVCF